MSKLNSGLTAFEQFGIKFSDVNTSSNSYNAECPFSGKEGKFYVNADNQLWDSKNTGKNGNLITFCRQYFEHCLSNTTDEILKPLSDYRGTPIWAFRGEVAYNPLNGCFLICYRNLKGDINNIGHYRLGSKGVIKTSGLTVELLGQEQLPQNDDTRSLDIFLLEGEWDYFAMKWLLARCGLQNAFPIGVAGAGIFSDKWINIFKGHKVYTCYDNDQAGKNGCDKVKAKLWATNTAKTISFLHWPVGTEEGYDIRDHIIRYSGDVLHSNKTSHARAYNMLTKYFRTLTPNEAEGKVNLIAGSSNTATNSLVDTPENVTIEDVNKLDDTLKNWLKLNNTEEFDIFYGAMLANKIDSGEPVWLLLVGPPGTKKTEMIMTLNKSHYVESTSTLTPASLICGFFRTEEPSLIPKLDKRVLAVKDLTSILSGNPSVRDEVFAILRDAYDGYVEKVFSSGKKSFKSRFGFIGGVTNTIDSYQTTLSSLGERFIKLRLDTPNSLTEELDIITRVLDNITREGSARDNIQDLVKKIMSQTIPTTLPEFTSQTQKIQLMYLGVFVARLRAAIVRNSYTNEQLVCAFHELGSRISKVFAKLAMGIAIYRKHSEITDYELHLIKRVALDTIPDRTSKIVRFIYTYQKLNNGKGPSTSIVSKELNLHTPTASKVLTDLCLLETIEKININDAVGLTFDSEFRLTVDLQTIIDKSKIFD